MDIRKQKQSTLEGAREAGIIVGGRRMGNTTRLIDRAIQILFSGKICVVRDHHENGQHQKANQDLFYRILNRIGQEHHHLVSPTGMDIDRDKLEIEIL